MSATASSGDRFGGAFTLVRPLGSGGTAEVWLAREDDLGREVAIKILNRGASAVAQEHFLSEAKSLAAVRHPGIVPILRFGVDEATNHPFFAMPVYPEKLASRLDRQGRLAEPEVAELGMALVPALAALHSAGLAHRDLKPSNVLLDELGTPVLADIGPVGGGTPAWAAPEQFAGEAGGSSCVTSGGGAADWHALGLLLYRALVGTLPPPRGILPAAIEPPRGTLPRDLRPRPSRGWERLLVALLDPEPATRLTEPAAILRALRRIRCRARWRAVLTHRRRALFLGLAVCVAAALLALNFADASRPRDPAVAQHAAPTRDTLFKRPFEVGNHGGELREERDAIPTIRGDEKRRAAQLRDALGNVERPLARLRSLLDAAMENPALDADGIVRVPEGAVLFAEDIMEMPEATILLDGGTLLLAPPRQFLARLASSWQERAEFLRATGDPDAPSALPPIQLEAWHAETQFLPWPILVGERGGTLERYDEWNETLFCVTNAIRRAPGVERAPLECRGFTDLILNRASLDPGLFVTGSGSVADVLPGGRIRSRRWFDPEDPL